jgi:hypothetical protein
MEHPPGFEAPARLCIHQRLYPLVRSPLLSAGDSRPFTAPRFSAGFSS